MDNIIYGLTILLCIGIVTLGIQVYHVAKQVHKILERYAVKMD